MMFFEGLVRIKIVGWTCAIFSVCVFIAPLSVMVGSYQYTIASVYNYNSLELAYLRFSRKF